MKKLKKELGMKWHNFLVYLWLPLNVLASLAITVFCGVLTYEYLVSSLGTELFNVNWVITFAYLALVSLVTFIFTIELRMNLRKLKSKGPKLLVVWYMLPVIFDIGALFVTQSLWPTTAPESQYVLYAFLGLIAAAFVRSFVMILLNISYFVKREELFDNLVYNAKKDIASQFDY